MAEWNPRANDIFVRAAEIDPPGARRLFVERQCNGDAALRAQVESLLAAGGQIGSFLQRPAVAGPGSCETAAYPLTEGPGTVVGPYKLLQHIGEGGMGVVYMAEQNEPVRRKVALKIIKPGMDSKQVVARFEAERQALSMMDHPNIARVLDAGTTDSGRPLFVMELVHGVPITAFCDDNKLTPRDRLALFVPVCQAIQHAHQKGVIHRDVKPSNVLVTMYDDRPVPKVIDFGVAKAVEQRLTEKTLFTQFGSLVGTFEYMSPEQAEMNAFGVDTRSDVYSLGVLLYELLTGSTPLERQRLREAALREVIRLIKEEEAPRPSLRLSTSGTLAKVAAARKTDPGKLSALVRGELDWIVMRCLEKDRTRRYETANGLARDVERYLAGDAVEACPPTLGYRLTKAYRRNRGAALAAGLVLAVLVTGVVGTSLGLVAANRARDAARVQELIALGERDEKDKALAGETVEKTRAEAALAGERQAAYDVTIPLIQTAIQENDFARASALLTSCPEDLRHWEWHFLNRQFDRGVVTLRPGYSGIRFDRSADQFTADGKLLVNCSEGMVRVRDAATGATRRDWDFGRDPGAIGNYAQPSPDRRLLAVWFQRKRTGFPPKEPEVDAPDVADKPFDVSLISVDTGRPVARLTGLPDRVRAVLFSPDASRLATAGWNNEVRVWDAAGKLLRTLKTDGSVRAVPVAFTPDGKSLVTNGVSVVVGTGLSTNGLFGGGDGAFRVWNLDPGTAVVTGRIAPYADWTNRFGRATQSLPNSKEPFARVSPDGRYAVGLASDVFKFAVDLASGKQVCPLSAGYTGLGFLPTGSLLAVNPDGVCTTFEVPGGKAVRSYPLPNPVPTPGTDEFQYSLGPKTRLSADGRWLTRYDSADGVVEVREAESGRVVRTVPTGRARIASPGPHTAIDPAGTRLLTSAQNGEQKLWDLSAETGARTVNLASESRVTPRVLAATTDGRRAAVLVDRSKAGEWARLELVDLRTGTSRVLSEVVANGIGGNAEAVFSPDGRKVAAMVEASFVRHSQYLPHVWDVETGKLLVRGEVISVSTHARWYDLGLPRLAYSPDGVPLLARLAVSKDTPGRKLWVIAEVVAEKKTAPARVMIPVGEESSIRLSADGRFAAVLGRSFDTPVIEVWDCEARRVLWSVPTEPGRVGKFDGFFSGDGSRLLLTDLPERSTLGQPTDAGPLVSVRDTRSGRVFSEFRLSAGSNVHGLSISPDGRRVFSTNTGGQTRSMAFNADTNRELVANLAQRAGLAVGGPVAQRLLPTADGNLITAQKRANAGDAACLLVWDGRKTTQPAKPSASIDDWLAEALRLTEDPDPAKRNPARALELTARARDLYPAVADLESAHGLALLRAGRFAEAADVLQTCVIREEAVERRTTFKKLPDGSKVKAPTMVARKATDYFLLALVTAGTGDAERARVWYRWGESRLLSPHTPGERRTIPALGEKSAEVERARAEPFRQEAARTLGLRANPITQADLRKLKHDPAHPINRLEWMLGRIRAGEQSAENEATAFWAVEFTLTHAEPIAELYYNAACVYSLASGKATTKKHEYAARDGTAAPGRGDWL